MKNGNPLVAETTPPDGPPREPVDLPRRHPDADEPNPKPIDDPRPPKPRKDLRARAKMRA